MDEARVGQKGGVTHVWYQKGVRPRGVRQQGFSSAYLFGAVCPERGEGVALVLPEVSTAAMGVFLAELARAVPAGTHAALVLDGAGWHVSDDLTVPANLTLIHPLPSYYCCVTIYAKLLILLAFLARDWARIGERNQ